MNLMKKVTRLVMATFMSTACLLGVAKGGEIKLWTLTPSNEAMGAAWKKLISDFEAANPGITVAHEQRSVDEHKAAMRVAAQSNQGPDIYFMWAGLGLGGEFVNAGLSLPLDSYYQRYDWDGRLLGAAASFSKLYGNERHGVPYNFRGEGIYYNKELFERADIATLPTTYAALKEAAEKLKEAGIPALTVGGSVNWHLMRLMDVILEATCGAEKNDQLMLMQLDWSEEPCAAASFAELAEWSQNYILKPFMGIDNTQSFNLFLNNRAAMMLEGDWLVGQLREAGRLEAFDIFPFPTGSNRLYGFAEYLYLSSKSQQADDSAKFLDYYLSDAVQQELLGTTGALSVNANATYENADDLVRKWLGIFADYSQIFMNGDQAFPLDVTTEYFRVINEVASDNMSPEAAGLAMQTFIANNRK